MPIKKAIMTRGKRISSKIVSFISSISPPLANLIISCHEISAPPRLSENIKSSAVSAAKTAVTPFLVGILKLYVVVSLVGGLVYVL